MGLSKTKYKCSKCGRVYDYHNHAVYVDTQSQTLVMKCPTDGAVAFWYDGEISSYEVEGAFDLMDVKVDNESKSVIFTMNRDETKQDKLTVKTDTPETVDISLKKDVLQVDVTTTGNNNAKNDNNITMVTPIVYLNVRYLDDEHELQGFDLHHNVQGKIVSTLHENSLGLLSLSQQLDIIIPLHYTLRELFENERPFKMGLEIRDNNVKELYYKVLEKMELPGTRHLPVNIDFELYNDYELGIHEKDLFTDSTATLTILDLSSDEPADEGEPTMYIQFSKEFSQFMNKKQETSEATYIHIRDIFSYMPMPA